MPVINLRVDKNGKFITPKNFDAYPADKKITWKIPSKKIIKNFMIESKDPNAPYPFYPPLNTNYVEELTITAEMHTATEWEYNIHWHDQACKHHLCDPKIAIKPDKKIFDENILLYLLIIPAAFYFVKKLFKNK